MQLRQTRRLPGRYREDEIPELPPNPTAVHTTIPFDPTLRPAVFPTLELDQFPPDHFQEDWLADAPPSIPSTPEQPAFVFHDTRVTPYFMMEETFIDPGEFVPRMAEEPAGYLSSPITAEEIHVEWKDLSKGIKIIIIREMCNEMPFFHAATFMNLDDADVYDFMDMLVGEIDLYDQEMARLDSVIRRRDTLVMGAFHDEAREVWDQYVARETSGTYESFALFSIKRDDVAKGKLFLLDFRCREEFPNFDPSIATPDEVEEMKCIPTSATIHAVISRLDSYIGTGFAYDDPIFERGLVENYQEAQRQMEEERQFELAVAASNESDTQIQPDLDATSPSARSDGTSNSGDADDEASSPPSGKKMALKLGKNAKTKASTELVNKRLSPNGKTKKKKKKTVAPVALPPSSLRNVTNADDIKTPEQSPLLPPLFSPEGSWVPDIAPRSPSPTVSYGMGQYGQDTAYKAPSVEQPSTEAVQASFQTYIKLAETFGELEATKNVAATAETSSTKYKFDTTEEITRTQHKSDITELTSFDSPAVTEPAAADVDPYDLVRKLQACANQSLHELGIAIPGLVDGQTPYVSVYKTLDQAHAAASKAEDDAETPPTNEVNTLVTTKVEETEKALDSASEPRIEKDVEDAAKTEVTTNHDAPAVEVKGAENDFVSKLTNTSEESDIPVSPTIENEGKGITEAEVSPVKEKTEEPKASTTKKRKASGTKKVNTKASKKQRIEEEFEEKLIDSDPKPSKKRTRSSAADELAKPTKKKRV